VKRQVSRLTGSTSTGDRARRGSGRFVLALLATACAALLLASAAAAETIQPELDPTQIGSFTCAPGNECSGKVSPATFSPRRLAVNETNGAVFILDPADDAIDIFLSTGVYAGQLFVPEDEGGSFEFTAEADIAIDNSSNPDTKGTIYVANSAAGDGSVFAFGANGAFKWKKSGFTNEACGIGVDPAGGLYVDIWEVGLQKLSSADGSLEGDPITTNTQKCQLAFDSAGDIVISYGFIEKLDSVSHASLGPFLPGLASVDVAVDALSDFNDVYGLSNDRGADVWQGDFTFLYGTGAGTTSGDQGLYGFALGGDDATLATGVTVNTAARRLYIATGSEVQVWSLPTPHSLATAATGEGSLTCRFGSEPAGDCATRYNEGEALTLEAHPAVGSTFAGWSGACTGTGACTPSLSADASVQAQFEPIQHSVEVTLAGSGKVTSSPAGIDCGSTCAAELGEADTLVLTATPAAHNHFVKWVGCPAVNGEGKCVIEEPTADVSVEAQFAPTMRKLTVAKAGSGSGSVSCDGGACAAEYQDGDEVTLTATPAGGSSFAGFSGGGCSASPCKVTLSGDTAVTVTFNANPVVTPPVTPTVNTLPTTNPPKPIKCKKGFKKKNVKGKAKCVRKPKHRNKHKGH
jgi:hypothetical protein